MIISCTLVHENKQPTCDQAGVEWLLLKGASTPNSAAKRRENERRKLRQA